MFANEVRMDQSIDDWLTSKDADIILNKFSEKNKVIVDKSEIIKAYLTTMLIQNAKIVRSYHPTEHVLKVLIVGYKKIIEYFKTNNWFIPVEANVTDIELYTLFEE